MIGNLNIWILVVVILSAFVLGIYFMLTSVAREEYTQANQFSGNNKMILVGPKGELTLESPSDIDSVINRTASSVLDDVSKGYQEKGDYQPAGDYIRRNYPYAIKMGTGNNAPSSENRYMKGSSDAWRVSYDSGNSNPKWLFV